METKSGVELHITSDLCSHACSLQSQMDSCFLTHCSKTPFLLNMVELDSCFYCHIFTYTLLNREKVRVLSTQLGLRPRSLKSKSQIQNSAPWFRKKFRFKETQCEAHSDREAFDKCA